MNDELFLARCLDLAVRGSGRVSPNPMVGACLVHQGRIIGEGYHEYFGGPHAEPNAVAAVPDTDRHLIPEATLYVSLEPCSIHSKTPPCTSLILEQQIQRVVVGSLDPNPAVNGKGVELLRNHGTEVILAEQPDDFVWLNRAFHVNQHSRRPWVVLKFARSEDGYIGKKKEQVWLSGDLSKVAAHKWRAAADAILVGAGTVRTDNPALTTRYYPGEHPKRVILNPAGDLSAELNVFDEKVDTVLVTGRKRKDLPPGIVQLELPGKRWKPSSICARLYQLGIGILLVEGGADTIRQFAEEGCWDEARLIDCPVRLKKGVKAPSVYGKHISTNQVGDDRHLHLVNPTTLDLLGIKKIE